MFYTTLLMAAALFASPAGFGDNNRPERPLPPPQAGQTQPMGMPGRGDAMRQYMRESGDGENEHSGDMRFENRPMMGSSTEDGRPIPPPEMMRFNGSTTNGMPPRFMGTSTDGRRLPPPQMMGSSTERVMREDGRPRPQMMGSSTSDKEHGTSTPPRPAVRAFMSNLFKFFANKHDQGTSTSEPTQQEGEQGAQRSASSTPPTPPPAVMEFFKNVFGNFFR